MAGSGPDSNGYLYKMMDLISGTATQYLTGLKRLMSITKDPVTGKIFLVGADGNAWVKEVCGSSIKDISTIISTG